MKAVIFAGGLGTRMREETEHRPKPMVEIGGYPVLLHLMDIYAAQGVTDFVILAGYKAGMIKDYFANLSLNTSDIVFIGGEAGKAVSLASSNLRSTWTITILDTGVETLTGERLLRAKEQVGSERFFATYGDGLAPVNLANLLRTHQKQGLAATMTITQPQNRFGVVEVDQSGLVESFLEKPKMSDWTNMGFFCFESSIFGSIEHGESLEEGLLKRLARDGQLASFKHEGFWQPMDTYRELLLMNELWETGAAPWTEKPE